MLDFLTITQDTNLGHNVQLVYWTLAAWSWSTIQFFVNVPAKRRSIPNVIAAVTGVQDAVKNDLRAYLTNSLLRVFFLDLPYFGIRIAAIFAFGSHSLNSYFFATKNLLLIIHQFYK